MKNQRFFGFKELSFATNLHDPAGTRDILVYDILREAGLPSLRAVPCEVVLDHGQGPERLGLFTMIEVVDDTGVPTFFGSEDGNIYEGNGPVASFGLGTEDQIEASLEKKNNEKAGDRGDVHGLYQVLHDPKRLADPAAWRADLERVFDVEGFLSLIGLGAIVGHIDTYGTIEAVSFYLYNDPATGRLTWISWDHNDTFQADPAMTRTVMAFDRDRVTDGFPLIRFLLDDPVYRARCRELLSSHADTVLDPDRLTARIHHFASVIGPEAAMPQPGHDAAVEIVIAYVRQRAADLEAFLASRPRAGQVAGRQIDTITSGVDRVAGDSCTTGRKRVPAQVPPRVGLDAVRAVILGQAPYPEPASTTGRAFEIGAARDWRDLDRMFSASVRAYTQSLLAARLDRPELARSFADWPGLLARIESGEVPVEPHGMLSRFRRDIDPHQAWRPLILATLRHVAVSAPLGLPRIGPAFGAFGSLSVLVAAMPVLVLASWLVLCRTRFGLRLAACGEHPFAALAIGANLALGTEVASSNDTMRVFDVMRVAALAQTLCDDRPEASEGEA